MNNQLNVTSVGQNQLDQYLEIIKTKNYINIYRAKFMNEKVYNNYITWLQNNNLEDYIFMIEIIDPYLVYNDVPNKEFLINLFYLFDINKVIKRNDLHKFLFLINLNFMLECKLIENIKMLKEWKKCPVENISNLLNTVNLYLYFPRHKTQVVNDFFFNLQPMLTYFSVEQERNFAKELWGIFTRITGN